MVGVGTADTAETRGQRAAYVSLISLTVANGAVTFALSFYGLFDYGIRVEDLPYRMAWMVPAGVDIFSLCGVAGTYLLRNAKPEIRAYAWLVFGIAVSLSVAGNITHANVRKLGGAGLVGAAAWPILFALAAHFVIVVRRALERAPEPPAAQISGLLSRGDPEGLCTARPAPTFVPELAEQPTDDAAQEPAPRSRRARSVARPHSRAPRGAKSGNPLREQVLALHAQMGQPSAAKIVEAMNGNAPPLRTVSYWISQAGKATTASTPPDPGSDT